MFILKIISLIVLSLFLIIATISMLKDEDKTVRIGSFIMFLLFWVPFIYIYLRG